MQQSSAMFIDDLDMVSSTNHSRTYNVSDRNSTLSGLGQIDTVLLTELRQQKIAERGTEQRAQVAKIALKYHITLGLLILLANGFLIVFYLRQARIRRYISLTMLSVFVASFFQVSNYYIRVFLACIYISIICNHLQVKTKKKPLK